MLTAILCVCSTQVNAQKVTEISKEEKTAFLANKEVLTLGKKLSTTGKFGSTSGKWLSEGCKRGTGKDDLGKVDISLITYSLNGEDKENTTEIVILKNNITKETKVWAENDKLLYLVEDNKVVESQKEKQDKANVGAKSIVNRVVECAQQFARGTSTSCSGCITCVSSCFSQNKSWKRIACAVYNCNGQCWSCITNIWNFAKCVFGS